MSISQLFTSGNCAEQGEAVTPLESALMDLRKLPHPQRAAGGFAGAIVSVIEQGLAAAGKRT